MRGPEKVLAGSVLPDGIERLAVLGQVDAAQRANTLWKSRLAAYEPPAIDAAVDEELRAFVDRRKSEMPDEIG